MKKLHFLLSIILFCGIFNSGKAQDTTSFRMAGFSDSGEMILFHDDSTNLYLGILNANASYNALFHEPLSGNLYCLHDTLQGSGNRDFYEFDPFMQQLTLAYDFADTFLAAACATPSGRIFAVTGNAAVAGKIYEVDIDNQLDSLFTTTDFSFGGNQSGLNISYYPSTDELWLFAGGSDSLIKINVSTRAEQRVACNLNADTDIKATYLDGSVFWLMSNTSFTLDVNQGLNVIPSTFTIPGYVTDLELLDLIEGGDTISMCDGDSAMLTSRFYPDDYFWYFNGNPMGIQTHSIVVGATGTYQFLAKSDNGYYMWSEEVYVDARVTPFAAFGQSDDTVAVGVAVVFSDSSSGGTNHSWDFGDGGASAQSNPTHVYATPGTYSVMMILANGTCMDTAFSEVVVLPLVGIDKPSAIPNATSLRCFPNPSPSVTKVNFELSASEIVRVDVLNVWGSVVAVLHDGMMDAGTNELVFDPKTADGNGKANAMYLVRLTTQQGTWVQRLLISR